ncbi:hypothetical protein EKH55_0986 [Sinorhizobium alkalisoli]|nr:hypothetical protein EKH55_0986 [Sinorhizobium alkalisoli]
MLALAAKRTIEGIFRVTAVATADLAHFHFLPARRTPSERYHGLLKSPCASPHRPHDVPGEYTPFRQTARPSAATSLPTHNAAPRNLQRSRVLSNTQRPM